MSQATYEKLRAMRLSAMADAYLLQTNDSAMEQLSFSERMGILTDAEWSQRKSNRLQRLIHNAHFDQPNAHVADIDYVKNRELNRELIIKLSGCDFIQDTRNIILTGATGSGKTFIACALGMEACKLSYSVRFVRMSEFLEELVFAKAEGTILKYYKSLAKVDLLIIDDWMLTKLTSDEASFLFEIIHRRHKRKSTILCSQFAPAGWHQRIPEETLADAILDRIVYDSYMLHLKTYDGDLSMRQKYGLTV